MNYPSTVTLIYERQRQDKSNAVVRWTTCWRHDEFVEEHVWLEWKYILLESGDYRYNQRKKRNKYRNILRNRCIY